MLGGGDNLGLMVQACGLSNMANSGQLGYCMTSYLKNSKLTRSVGTLPFFFFKIYLFIICKYTAVVFRHSRRGRKILLQMVVSHHVVAGIWKSSRVLLPAEPSNQSGTLPITIVV